jgi:hypothetical protein
MSVSDTFFVASHNNSDFLKEHSEITQVFRSVWQFKCFICEEFKHALYECNVKGKLNEKNNDWLADRL